MAQTLIKILIYAHEGVGYGHIAKMANLSSLLIKSNSDVEIDIVSSYCKIWKFVDNYTNINFLKLPQYNSLNNNSRLEFLRKIFLSKYDKIIIDFFLFGTKDELLNILPEVRRRSHAKIILTLRGIIFSKKHTIKFWKGEQGIDFINEIYSQVICLCDPKIININSEYFENKINIPIKYLGYVYRKFSEPTIKERTIHHIVVNFGGGYKCDKLLLSVLEIIKQIDFFFSIIIGEYFSSECKNQAINLANKYPYINVLMNKTQYEIDKLHPSVIIGCGGYNTTVNAIFNSVPLIVIPKEVDFEAKIHMNRLKRFSSIQVLEPGKIDLLPQKINSIINSTAKNTLKNFHISDTQEFLN